MRTVTLGLAGAALGCALFVVSSVPAPVARAEAPRQLTAAQKRLLWDLACAIPSKKWGRRGDKPTGTQLTRPKDGERFLPDDCEYCGLATFFHRRGAKALRELAASVSERSGRRDPPPQGHDRRVALKLVEYLAGIPVDLKPDAPFAAINPAAVRWVDKNLLPKPSTAMCGATAGEVYRLSFRFAVRAYADALVFHAKRDSWAAVKSASYLEERRAMRGPFTSACARHAIGKDDRYPNMVREQGCHFWLRRELDGSRKAVAEALANVLRDFDPRYWKKIRSEYPK